MKKKVQKTDFNSSFFKTELLKTSIFLIFVFTIGSILLIQHEEESYKNVSNYIIRQQTENAAANSVSYFERHEWILQYLADSDAVQALTSAGQVAEGSKINRDIVQEMEHIRVSIPDRVSNVFLATFPAYQLFDSFGHTFPTGEWVAQRPWWKNMDRVPDGLALSEVYEDYITHLKTITLTLPIKQNETLMGVVGLDVDITKLDSRLRNIKIGETGYIVIIDSQGKLIWHPDQNKVGDSVLEWNERDYKALAVRYQEPTNLSFQANGQAYFGAAVYVPKLSALIVGVIPREEIETGIKSESFGLVLVISVCIILFILMSVLNIARTVRPIQRVDKISSMLVTGQLDVHIAPKRTDELGRLEYNLGVLADWLKMQRRKLEIERQITETMRISALCETPEEMLAYMVQRMQVIFQSDRAYIFELNKQNCWDNTYESAAEGVAQGSNVLKMIPYAEMESWVSIFEDHKCLISKNIDDLSEIAPELCEKLKAQGVHSIAVAPLIYNELIGFWGVDNPRLEDVEQYTTDMITAGSFMSGLLRRRDLVARIEHMSFYDELTKLGNRHLLADYLEHINIDSSMGVYFADITGLKRVNDTQGHAAGDNLIVRAANAMASAFRTYDVFRYGGDELLALCSKIKEDEMEQRLEAIKKIAAESDVALAIGMSWAENGRDLSKLIQEAESNMYEDKRMYYERTGIDRRRR